MYSYTVAICEVTTTANLSRTCTAFAQNMTIHMYWADSALLNMASIVAYNSSEDIDSSVVPWLYSTAVMFFPRYPPHINGDVSTLSRDPDPLDINSDLWLAACILNPHSHCQYLNVIGVLYWHGSSCELTCWLNGTFIGTLQCLTVCSVLPHLLHFISQCEPLVLHRFACYWVAFVRLHLL